MSMNLKKLALEGEDFRLFGSTGVLDDLILSSPVSALLLDEGLGVLFFCMSDLDR